MGLAPSGCLELALPFEDGAAIPHKTLEVHRFHSNILCKDHIAHEQKQTAGAEVEKMIASCILSEMLVR